jgi:hypothetical protein
MCICIVAPRKKLSARSHEGWSINYVDWLGFTKRGDHKRRWLPAIARLAYNRTEIILYYPKFMIFKHTFFMEINSI